MVWIGGARGFDGGVPLWVGTDAGSLDSVARSSGRSNRRSVESHLRAAHWIVRNRWLVSGACLLVVAVGSYGVQFLTCRIDPLDFLPKGSHVVKDLNALEEKLTSIDSVEAIIDFRTSDVPFMEKLSRVKEIEARLGTHQAVTHTMSIASFFPDELPQGLMDRQTSSIRRWAVSIAPTFCQRVNATGESPAGFVERKLSARAAPTAI